MSADLIIHVKIGPSTIGLHRVRPSLLGSFAAGNAWPSKLEGTGNELAATYAADATLSLGYVVLESPQLDAAAAVDAAFQPSWTVAVPGIAATYDMAMAFAASTSSAVSASAAPAASADFVATQAAGATHVLDDLAADVALAADVYGGVPLQALAAAGAQFAADVSVFADAVGVVANHAADAYFELLFSLGAEAPATYAASAQFATTVSVQAPAADEVSIGIEHEADAYFDLLFSLGATSQAVHAASAQFAALVFVQATDVDEISIEIEHEADAYFDLLFALGSATQATYAAGAQFSALVSVQAADVETVTVEVDYEADAAFASTLSAAFSTTIPTTADGAFDGVATSATTFVFDATAGTQFAATVADAVGVTSIHVAEAAVVSTTFTAETSATEDVAAAAVFDATYAVQQSGVLGFDDGSYFDDGMWFEQGDSILQQQTVSAASAAVDLGAVPNVMLDFGADPAWVAPTPTSVTPTTIGPGAHDQIIFDMPALRPDGDVYVVFISRDTEFGPTQINGWQTLAADTNPAGNTMWSYVGIRTGQNEPAQYVVETGEAHTTEVSVLRIPGVYAAGAVITVGRADAGHDVAVAPAVTVEHAGSLVLRLYHVDSYSLTSVPPTEIINKGGGADYAQGQAVSSEVNADPGEASAAEAEIEVISAEADVMA